MESCKPKIKNLVALVTAAFFVCSWILVFNMARADETKDAATKEEILSLYEKLKKMEIDTARAAKLENFSFKKDIFEWKLESGYLFMTKPIPEFPKAGGAYFIGQGKMIFEPPNKVEKEELKKYTNKERFNEPFREAFIRFNDDTRQLFEPLMRSISGEEAKKAVEKFQNCQKTLEDLFFNIDFPIIEDYFSEIPRNQYLFFEADLEKIGLLTFSYNPASVEEISLFTRKKLGFGVSGFGRLITAFHKKEDYEAGIDIDYEDKDILSIFHYDMDFTIEPTNLLMHAKVSIHFRSLVDKLSAFEIELIDDPDRHDKLIMNLKFTDDQGKEIPFIYKNYAVLIQLPKAYEKGEDFVLHASYDANFIRPDAPFDIDKVPQEYRILFRSLEFLPSGESTFTLLNTYPWFPQYGYLKRYTFNLTIRVPKPFIAIASGTTMKRWEEGNYNCLQSQENKPVLLASVLFGKYYTIKDDSKRPVIFVHSLFKQQRQAEVVLKEARTIVDLFEEKFGPFPYDEFDIAQMGFFYGFGQAPPGLVQLTGEAYLAPSEIAAMPWLSGKADFRSEFLSHEIGHEWWAHVVSWKNYHEQWLSESFTEYMAGLYVEAAKGPKEFENKMKEWKEIAYARKDSGPIWLGYRNQQGYVAALYFKGPYVLHMLRRAFIWKFGADEGNRLFFACLRNFCDKFRDQSAVTKDFQKIVKETAKVDMDWFFNQWFREAGFPELKYSYTSRQTEDGKYLVEVKVKQTDKDHIKTMVIPIYFHFPENKVHRVDKIFDREELIFKFKFPQKPENVTLDDTKELLANISWGE